ncbi:MAG: hypothetical protein RMM58_01465 [Chloroflexota bacterium]|nr:hypothetical protein [Dehalococcoidia bacterium]MDW8252528.1 hypothetical protein [Chloroflexota bacterium]
MLDAIAPELRTPVERHVGWLLMLRDVTDRTRLERQLRDLAFHDALTGLVNRCS